jgi:hypothetical protein
MIVTFGKIEVYASHPSRSSILSNSSTVTLSSLNAQD